MSTFIRLFLSEKDDFPQEFVRVGKTVRSLIICESVKPGALVEAEKLAFEY